MITFRGLKRTPEEYAFIKEHIGCVICEDTTGIVAERDGKIVGMYVFNSWTENSVQGHQGITDPLVFKHGFHKKAASYVYGQAGREMMIGLTPSDNEKAIKLNEHYGYREECRVPNAVSDGVDYIVYVMRRDDCPYYEPETGDVAQRSAA